MERRWTQNAISTRLKADRRTIRQYIEQIAIFIPDFKADCLKNPDGTCVTNSRLTDYQAWVLFGLVEFGREVRSEMNGFATLKIIKANVIKKMSCLSKAYWQSTQNVKVS